MKTTKIFLFPLFFAVLFIFSFNVNADSSFKPQSNVSGTVYGKGQPLAGITVMIYQHNRSNVLGTTVTDGGGNYSFTGISGEIDLLICFPEDEDEDFVSTWYTSATDQSGATAINVTSDMSGINITAIAK
ncbi:MAG: carboxypeptidase regulatory-like domain-containing protein [Ignavibacteriae bacterium]|nr:carboxypeptidase regulatory-like domain-containing protein [Ignavibacteriota bacterium]MCB9243487.1 carboxypeptidase regulatory-like domain-containing protein [Ignavibacteriales bacterium]